MTTPADLCDCFMLTGAHDERCSWVKHVRRSEYEPDVEIPARLVRRKPTPPPPPGDGGAFD